MWFRKQWRNTSDLLPMELTVLRHVADALKSDTLAAQLLCARSVERNTVADGYSALIEIRSRDADPLDRLDGYELARVRVSGSAGVHAVTITSVGGYVAVLRFSGGCRIKDPTKVEINDVEFERLAPKPLKRVSLAGWVKDLRDSGVIRETTIPVSPEDIEEYDRLIQVLPDDYLELVRQTNGVVLAIEGQVHAVSEVSFIDMKGGRQVVCCGDYRDEGFFGTFGDDPKRGVYYFTATDDPGELAGSNLQEALIALPKLVSE